MNKIKQLEELAALRQKGVLSDAEFNAQKKNILQQNLESVREQGKSGVIYYLLAFFLGTFGIHNFYLKRNARGALELTLNLISWLGAWAIGMMFAVQIYQQGVVDDPAMMWVVLSLLLQIIGIVVLGMVIWDVTVTKTDALGNAFKPSPVAKRIVLVLMYLVLIYSILTPLVQLFIN